MTEADSKANFVRTVQDLCFKLNSILQGKLKQNKITQKTNTQTRIKNQVNK